jgi:hypothetical protein
VNERRRLQRLARTLAAHVGGSQAAELVVYPLRNVMSRRRLFVGRVIHLWSKLAAVRSLSGEGKRQTMDPW